MSGCGRERGINAANKKLVDSFHPMNLFSRVCSPCSNTSRQLQCTKIKEQIKMSLPPLIPWSSAVTNIEADLFLSRYQPSSVANLSILYSILDLSKCVIIRSQGGKSYFKYINFKWSTFQTSFTKMITGFLKNLSSLAIQSNTS